jgi:hypothetical protein
MKISERERGGERKEEARGYPCNILPYEREKKCE